MLSLDTAPEPVQRKVRSLLAIYREWKVGAVTPQPKPGGTDYMVQMVDDLGFRIHAHRALQTGTTFYHRSVQHDPLEYLYLLPVLWGGGESNPEGVPTGRF